MTSRDLLIAVNSASLAAYKVYDRESRIAFFGLQGRLRTGDRSGWYLAHAEEHALAAVAAELEARQLGREYLALVDKPGAAR